MLFSYISNPVSLLVGSNVFSFLYFFAFGLYFWFYLILYFYSAASYLWLALAYFIRGSFRIRYFWLSKKLRHFRYRFLYWLALRNFFWSFFGGGPPPDIFYLPVTILSFNCFSVFPFSFFYFPVVGVLGFIIFVGFGNVFVRVFVLS